MFKRIIYVVLYYHHMKRFLRLGAKANKSYKSKNKLKGDAYLEASLNHYGKAMKYSDLHDL